MHPNEKGRSVEGGDPRVVPDGNRETDNALASSAPRLSLQALRSAGASAAASDAYGCGRVEARPASFFRIR
jgi:hypothetical protein